MPSLPRRTGAHHCWLGATPRYILLRSQRRQDSPRPTIQMAAPRYDLSALRAQIPLLAHTIPLNNCSQAPLTTVTRAAADRFLDEWNRQGMDWESWMAEVERARRAFAMLINADADEVAVMSSVSHAASAVATAIRFDDGRDRRRRQRCRVPDGWACLACAAKARRACPVGWCARWCRAAGELRRCHRRANGRCIGGTRLLPERRAAGCGGHRQARARSRCAVVR